MSLDVICRPKRKATKIQPAYSPRSSAHTHTEHYARILQHLRDDIAKSYPEERMPSNWLLDCLTRSLYEHSMKSRPWEESIYCLLMKMAAFVETSEGHEQGYFDSGIQKSLFPEQAYYSPKQALRFTTYAIIQLRKVTSHSAVWRM